MSGGILSSLLISTYLGIRFGIIYDYNIGSRVFFNTFLELFITALAIGFILGILIGSFYHYKDITQSKSESISDEFFDDLIEK